MSGDLRDQLQASLGSAYSLERELGGGGMSRVFLATETALGRQVVVKVLPPETAAGVSIDRFKREIMLAARLQHPHIVPLLSAGEATGLPYFTMPFVDGESLRVRLTRHGEFPVAEAMRVLREIAAALAYAHEHGIIHRDIKPDNVLLSGGSAIVTDFGVAKALSASSNAELSGVTSQGIALGTPAYMAPEQATADPAIDHRADLYAFGVLAYELLTGQPPFTGRTPMNLLAAHVNEAPESLSRRRASLPPALSALVMRCLEKRPADRPQRASEIVHALDDITTPSGGMKPTSAAQAVRGAIGAGTTGKWPTFSSGTAVSLAVVLVALGAIGWIANREKGTPSGDVSLLKTVAVLPFSSGDTASEYFAEGITDELHSELARAQGLTVKARSVRTQFKDQSDLAAVAARLGIGSLVVGSVSRAGSRVRITAELMRVSDNSTLWSQKFDGDERNLFALQDSIARAIAAALSARLADANGLRRAPTASGSMTAYDLYLRGRFQLQRVGSQPKLRAIELFRQAIAADSSLARAYVGLGQALWVLPYYSNTLADSVYLPAMAAVNEALALDSTLAEAYAARGAMLESRWPYRWDEAKRSLQRAIEIDPRDARSRVALGGYLYGTGQIEESIAEFRRATQLDPYYTNAWENLGVGQLAARQFDAAIASFRQARALEGDYDDIHDALAIVFVLQGKIDAALGELAAHAHSDANTPDLAAHAFVYARAGQRARAESIARDLEQRALSSPDAMGPLGYVLLGLGDSTAALEWFIRAADARVRPMRALWADIPSPEVDPIRSLPRYPELLRKLNLQDQPVARLKAVGR